MAETQAQLDTVPEGQPPAKSEAKLLMEQMGSRSWNPMPPKQHQWQRGKGWPDVIRLWGWMCDHTIHWGHRSAYAVDIEGHALHIENAAESLKMDEANARRAWRLGRRMGLWGHRLYKNRAKDAVEEEEQPGSRRRLYLYGEVDLQAAEEAKKEDETGEDKANTKVCTDLLSLAMVNEINKSLPEYMFEAFKGLKPPERERFALRFLPADRAERAAMAEVVGAVRSIFGPQKDTIYSEFKLDKIHAVRGNGKSVAGGKPGAAPPQGAAGVASDPPESVKPVAAACRQALLPLMERYVQTFAESVQSWKSAGYRPTEEAGTAPVSLLPQVLPEKSQIMSASGQSESQGQPEKPQALRRESGPQVATQGQESEESDLKPEEKAALDLLFSQTRAMQNKFPHTKFGEFPITLENKGDLAWARRVLAKVGASEMEGYLYDVGVRLGLSRNALGKLPSPKHNPAANPHDRYLGLMLEWAEDWVRSRPARERIRREDEEARVRRKGREAAAAAEQEKEEARARRAQEAWDKMSADQREVRIEGAMTPLRTEPRWTTMDRAMKRREAEHYAILILGQELEKGGSQ
jgi:hypothetical protein